MPVAGSWPGCSRGAAGYLGGNMTDQTTEPTGSADLSSYFLDINPSLVRYLRRLSHDRAVAEDVAQLAWTRLLEMQQRRGLPGASAELRALLFTLARNAFVDRYLRSAYERRTVRVDPWRLPAGEPDDAAQPESAMAGAMTRRLLIAAARSLSGVQLSAITAWLVDADLSAVATTQRIPLETLLSRKKAALRSMRHSLSVSGLESLAQVV